PSAWERYRFALLATLAAMLLQTAIIAWLTIERHARRTAELEARRRSMEVLHLNRSAEAGALSASFAHELSQPLAAIMMSIDAVEGLLKSHPPEVARSMELLADIRETNCHATEVIRHLGKLLKPGSEAELQDVDLNKVIADALQVLLPEAKKRQVTVSSHNIQHPLFLRADPVHIQQVIVNLVTNGLDAMTDTPCNARKISIQTALVAGSHVEVSVSDSGTGIPAHKLVAVFDTFYTTKKEG